MTVVERRRPGSQPPAPAAPVLPVIGDGFEVLEVLGRGGIGVVYRALQRSLHREVAIKLLHNVTNPALRGRFEREAIVASRLCHTNIVTVFDYSHTSDGRPFITMELVRGITL